MSHLPVNSSLAHTHTHWSRVHTLSKGEIPPDTNSRDRKKAARLARGSNFSSHFFFSTSPPGFPLKTLDVAAALTAVGVRVMTSSGFPSVLCYSELTVLSRLLHPAIPSAPPNSAAALMFHHLLMLRCHRPHWPRALHVSL